MAEQYGILGLPSSMTSVSNRLNIGWKFLVGSSALNVRGLRAYLPVTQTGTIFLWDASTQALIASVNITGVANTWTEGYLTSPVTLEPNKAYTLSMYVQNWYTTAATNFTFNPLITFQCNQHTSASSSYPASSDNATKLYNVLDIVFATEQYKAEGTLQSSAIPLPSVANVLSSSIMWEDNIPANTSLEVSVAVTDGEVPTIYNVLQKGDALPGIIAGESITNKFLWIKARLATTDPYQTPTLATTFDVVIFENMGEQYMKIYLNPLKRFQNVNGEVTVHYDASKGKLRGRGGYVNSFDVPFTPVDLNPKINPWHRENIELSFSFSTTLRDVTYPSRYTADHHISGNAGGFTFVVTQVADDSQLGPMPV